MPSIIMYGDYYHHQHNPYLYETQLQHRLQPRLVEQRTFTRLEILRHNASVGWQQWVTLKGMVYDATGFRDHFLQYVQNNRHAQEDEVLNGEDSARLDYMKQTVTVAERLFKRSRSCEEHLVSWTRKGEVKRKSSLHEHSWTKQCRTLSCGRLRVREEGSTDCLMDDDVFLGTRHCQEQTSTCQTISPGAPGNKKEACDSDLCGDDSDLCSDDKSTDSETTWQHDVIHVLRQSGLSLSEVEAEIGPFAMGTIERVPAWRVWDSIRADVITLHEDLTRREERGEVSQYQREYLTLLGLWLRKYRDIDPLYRPPARDPNNSVYILSQDPSTLREWTLDLQPLDTSLPEEGAWLRAELVLPPLGNTHKVFASSLRSPSSSDDTQFSFDIAGEAAWRVLPLHVIDGEMTKKQKAVQQSRDQRGDALWNPERMRRRRRKLGKYFMEKYGVSSEKMAGFLQWADVIESNARRLERLCCD